MKKILRKILLWLTSLVEEEPALLEDKEQDIFSEECILDAAVLDAEWDVFILKGEWTQLAMKDRKTETPDGRCWVPRHTYPPGSFSGKPPECYRSKNPPIGGSVWCHHWDMDASDSSPGAYKRLSYAKFRREYPSTDMLRDLEKKIAARNKYEGYKTAALEIA